MGFGIPGAEWLRTGKRALVCDALTHTTATRRVWYNAVEVKKVIDIHMSSVNKGSIIGPMLMLELRAGTWLD